MNKLSISLISLSCLILCGCGEASVQTSQPSITVNTNVVNQEASAKKTTTTKTKTTNKAKTNTQTPISPSATNSAIKSLIIDGNGNLVSTNANNTFTIIGNVKGEKGDKGDKGDSIQGEKGEKGDTGRGIDHCELTDSKDLIVYYTDGTSQNVGNLLLSDEVADTHEYEKIGYEVPLTLKGDNLLVGNDYGYDYEINNVKLTLVDINPLSADDTEYLYKMDANLHINNPSANFTQIELVEYDIYKNNGQLFIFCSASTNSDGNTHYHGFNGYNSDIIYRTYSPLKSFYYSLRFR